MAEGTMQAIAFNAPKQLQDIRREERAAAQRKLLATTEKTSEIDVLARMLQQNYAAGKIMGASQ